MTPGSPATSAFRRALIVLAVFSVAINILLLAQSVYAIQIYDRVLTSRSTDTLFYLSLLMALALVVTALLDTVRSLVANRAATHFEVTLSDAAMRTTIEKGSATASSVQSLRDISTLRSLISSRALLAILDLPFAILFAGLMYIVHPVLFWLTLTGAVTMACLAALNQWALAASARRQADLAAAAQSRADSIARSADSILAMGMVGNVIGMWGNMQAESLRAADGATTLNAWFSGVSRFLRYSLQAAILGVSALLVLRNEMSAGLMFAASMISGRALQPIDPVIGSWRQIATGQQAWQRVRGFLEKASRPRYYTALSPPAGGLEVLDLVQPDPAGPHHPPVLSRISFRVDPGVIVAVLGPSGVGKTTLARILVGVLQPRSGIVRVDGHELKNWDPAALGRAVGYMAQDVELLPGTVAQNIARFNPYAEDTEVIAAARAAHAEDLIQRLPNGYDTMIGPGELQLSGGERQRIALARSLYGNPRLIVLDEPNANLDRAGEAALMRALQEARTSGATILVITQRDSLLACADKIMRLQNGVIAEFDDRDTVLMHLRGDGPRPAPRPVTATLRAAGGS